MRIDNAEGGSVVIPKSTAEPRIALTFGQQLRLLHNGVLQRRLFRYVVLDILHGSTYEILGTRPLLIDKLSSILIPKDGVPLPRKDPAY
jgi:hypothetical protein